MIFRKIFYSAIALLILQMSASLSAQVKITDGASLDIDPNSILELESSNKGLLIPRVSLISLTLPAPLTVPIPEGMLVYNKGGSVSLGFYYWNGTSWFPVTGSGKNSFATFFKDADAVLDKLNSLVVTNKTLTLTLPEITASDTGLSITIKNNGSHTDLVTIKGSGTSLIDSLPQVKILPHQGITFTGLGSDWIMSERPSGTSEILNVGPGELFKDIYSALEFLAVNMEKPAVIRLTGESEYINKTITVNLPYPVTIQGISYGTSIIKPAAGLNGKPVFRCLTDCYFKMLSFDATTLAGYGTNTGEDAIRLSGASTYHEIKDCTFNGFYNSIIDSSNSELWMFECDISNSYNAGLMIDGMAPGVKIRVSETDFISCNTGIYLAKGSDANIQIMSGVFENDPDDVAIRYNPSNFSFTSLIISNNSWNHLGTGMTGFDFSRADGRDANAYIENNPGLEGNLPHCKINVINNTSTTVCSIANNWYKTVWTNTSQITTNMAISGNKVTYLSDTKRDLIIFVSGNVLVNSINRAITVGIVKNGDSGIRYGETTLRITTANQPFQFSTVIYLQDMNEGDYFELFCSSVNSGDILIFQDINIFVMSEK